MMSRHPTCLVQGDYMKPSRKKSEPPAEESRASISFPPEVNSELEKLGSGEKGFACLDRSRGGGEVSG
jgi:hypothetical protein